MGKTKQVTVNHVVDEDLTTIWERKVTIPIPDNLTPDEEHEFIEDYLSNHVGETMSDENITSTHPWCESNWNSVVEVA